MRERVAILNGTFDRMTIHETVDAIFAAADCGDRGWLCTVNVSTLMTMRKNAGLQSFVDHALFVVADGQPLVWSAPLFGGRLPERVAGADLMDALCKRAATEQKRVYLLGSTSSLVYRALQRLRARHHGLQIVGSHGYFPAHESKLCAETIRRSGATILLVGMGTPRQEAFIEQHWDDLGVEIAIGVGGSIDVIAGARIRAHPWIARSGMEWLVRLAQEPRRLLPRYVMTNSAFCVLIAKTIIARFRHALPASIEQRCASREELQRPADDDRKRKIR
jgi:N-acetylglucosaminyldiphosphoundecaprenol N-acetyl-beta-D-mannosaminyltransferase